MTNLPTDQSRIGAAVVLRPAGELDAYVAPELRDALREHTRDAGVEVVVLDLTKVTFIDSAALGVIVGAFRTVRERDAELRIVAPSSPAARIFELTSLDRVLDFYSSVELALVDC